MASVLSFKLSIDVTETIEYAGATGSDPASARTVKLIATKRENANCCNSFPASILTAVVMFPAQGTAVPENITLQGIHDLASNNETGSVSAASPQFADFIGGNFTFDGKSGVLKISPRA